MGYRIDYPSTGRKKKSHIRAFLIFGLILSLGLNLFVKKDPILLRLLFPEDIAATAASLEEMLTLLKSGAPFSDAFQVFCHQVIYG